MAEEAPLITRIGIEGEEDTVAALRDFFQTFKEGRGDIAAAETEMRNYSKSIYGARRALMLIRTEWRMQHAAWIEGARLMRDVGRIGRSITQMWTAYNVGQIRVERATRDVEEAVIELSEAQQLHTRYLRDFGEESIYTIRAHERLENASQAEKDARERLATAQRDNILGYVGMGLQAGELIAVLPMLRMHLHMLTSTLGLTTTSVYGLATAFGSLMPYVALFIAGIPDLMYFYKEMPEYNRSVEEGALSWQEFYEASKLAEEGWMGLSMRGKEIIGILEEMRLANRDATEAWEEMGRHGYRDIRIMTRFLHEAGYAEEEIRRALEELGYAFKEVEEEAYGKSFFPELVNWLEKTTVLTRELSREARTLKFGSPTTTPTTARTAIRQVSISNYFSGISSELDLERTGDMTYRRLIEKLEAIR